MKGQWLLAQDGESTQGWESNGGSFLAMHSTQQWLLRLTISQSPTTAYDRNEELNESGFTAGGVSKQGEVAHTDSTLGTVGERTGQMESRRYKGWDDELVLDRLEV